jgi:hypothetical protein
MARKAWEALSEPYRRRLESKGIGRFQHAGGGDLRGARGHGETPERPGRLSYGQRVERAGQAIKLMRDQGIGEREAARRVDLHIRSLRTVFREFGITTGGRLRKLDESEASMVPFPVGGIFQGIWVEPAHRVLGVNVGVASEIGHYHNDLKFAVNPRRDRREALARLRPWRGRVVLDLAGTVHPYITDLDLLLRANAADPEPWATMHIGGS